MVPSLSLSLHPDVWSKCRLARCLCSEPFLIVITGMNEAMCGGTVYERSTTSLASDHDSHNRRRANQEHRSQSRPECGLGLSHFQCERLSAPSRRCLAARRREHGLPSRESLGYAGHFATVLSSFIPAAKYSNFSTFGVFAW